MAHTCKALIIHCMDFRFHSAIREWLLAEGLEDGYDVVSLAGATKGLAENDPISSAILLDHIALSKRLHGISEVILLHHMDCGAYGGHKAFGNVSEEKEKQETDLGVSAGIIQSKFPELTILKALAHIEESEGGKAAIKIQTV